MRLIKFIALALAMSSTAMLSAQSGKPWINRAVEYYKLGNIDGSKDAIEKALEHDDVGGNAYAWHFKGFIYKELYKNISDQKIKEEYRELAVMSVERSIELDVPEQFTEENFKALDFLAVTFQRDSYTLSGKLYEDSLKVATKKFSRFKTLYTRLYPDSSFNKMEADFYNALGRGFNKMEAADREQEERLTQKALAAYEKVLAIDDQNYTATVNKGITIYNAAVKKIRAIDYRTEIFELIMVQDECVTLFRRSLPYFQSAYKLAPKKRLPLQALVAVYKSLNDPKTAAQFEDILIELEAAGQLEK